MHSERQDILDRIRHKPDVSVLIVGGGIMGAGLFRELALQGVDVLLAERGDFCSGASAAPSRMIHAGVRYLEFGEKELVRETVRERNWLLRNAPHYIRPLPTTFPLYSRSSGLGHWLLKQIGIKTKRPPFRGKWLVKMGLKLYDKFAQATRVMPTHRFYSREESLARHPGIDPNITGTALYYDAWITYPERLGLEVLLDGEALCPPCHALNYLSLQSASGAEVTLRDELAGEELTVRPKIVVNATGAWIDFVNARLGHQTEMIGGTKGAHLVMDNDDLNKAFHGGMIFYETPDGRISISMTWLGKALIGSTDLPVDDPDEVRCTDEEIDYMLDAIRFVVPGATVDRSQILSTFTGVRPLARSRADTPGQASRAHRCGITEPTDEIHFPVISMIGGKWTPFRGFAEHAADAVLPRLAVPRKAGSLELAIGGGKDYPTDDDARTAWVADLAEETGLPADRVETLLDRYGTRAKDVAAYLTAEPDAPLAHHATYTRREIEYLLTERVWHLDDLLLRRTAIALLGELTPELLAELAALAAAVHHWSDAQTAEEIERTKQILREHHSIDMR